MKIILLGKSGMLGSYLLKALAGRADFEMYAFSKNDLDITDFLQVKKTLKRISPDFVINATAYTKVDDCESNQELAYLVNSEAVLNLAITCSSLNSTLIHFSTDYVFDGENTNGYSESDIPNPQNIYGDSKLKGENAIIDNLKSYYIIRTSWLFGPNGHNFVKSMLDISHNKKEIGVVHDQIGSPTYTADLSESVIESFLYPHYKNLTNQHEYFFSKSEKQIADTIKPFGIYHITNSGECSWFDFAKKIFDFTNKGVSLVKTDSLTYKRPAKRPKYSKLINTKIPLLRSWDKALKNYIELHHPN